MEYNVSRYIEMLTLENQRQNLISRKNTAYEINKHIEDSLKIGEVLENGCLPPAGEKYWLTGERKVESPYLHRSYLRPIILPGKRGRLCLIGGFV
jgi:hypothetical protein